MRLILTLLFLGVSGISFFWSGLYYTVHIHAKRQGAKYIADEQAGNFAYALVIGITSLCVGIAASGVLW